MSSASVQSSPQHLQPASPYAPGASPRQYAQSSPHSREGYHTNQELPVSSNGPQSRRQDRQVHISNPNSPMSQPYTSPVPTSYPSPQNSQYSAAPVSSRHQPAPVDQYDGPPVPPPRSSSQRPSNQVWPVSATSPQTRVTPRGARPVPDDGRQYDGRIPNQQERRVESSAPNPTADARTRHGRRTGPSSPNNPGGSRETSQPPQVSAQRKTDHVQVVATPPNLTRENSEVINRVVVSNPTVDIQREEERMAEARPSPAVGLAVVGSEGLDDGARRRQDYSRQPSRRKDVQFGEYMLGQTLGEGEFGKVKLGWKRDGTVQVAIKLIRRESVETNPSRLPKIYREISILRELSHPNIVRLHEMVKSDRHIGIILEYASGGELFDYILNHRYLKDPAARRLFAQLVSGVGYLHKKGIVHRDLKLENLLLDRNRNIIITDFGFANTFNPSDDLSDDVTYNLSNREFVKKYRLDRQDERGMRKGDLMQTSCGSPCYAAPELVVSDSLYTGRKVDVWSCGVILYAMLAGYLPFDDDPANPEGDNINLLYKYITTTALTFPEYVTPHARDLLRRILVPDPRKRADLFEVARHSWLSEYHHVVSHITSSTTNIADISNTTVPSEEQEEAPQLARSASVREPAKATTQNTPSPGLLTHQQGKITDDDEQESGSRRRNVNRHTIQPEYVEPQSHTSRVGVATGTAATASAPVTRTRSNSQGGATPPAIRSKPLPQDPQSVNEVVKVADYPNIPSSSAQQNRPLPTRPARDVPRSTSDSTGAFTSTTSQPQAPPARSQPVRPSTGNATLSPVTSRTDPRLPSRGSYGQPAAPMVEVANAHGRVTQPYNMSGGQPTRTQSINRVPVPAKQGEPVAQTSAAPAKSHHRRTSTLSGLGEKLFGRSGSILGRKDERPKRDKKYPPNSMKESHATANPQPRTSMESKRSFSFGLGKKSVDLDGQYQQAPPQMEEKPKRFSSILPPSFSLRGFSGGKELDLEANDYNRPATSDTTARPSTQPSRPSTGQYRLQSSGNQSSNSKTQPYSQDGQQDRAKPQPINFSRPPQAQQSPNSRPTNDIYGGTGVYSGTPTSYQQQAEPSYAPSPPPRQNGLGADQNAARPPRPSQDNGARPTVQQGRQGRGVLHKNNRNFHNAHEYDQGPGKHEGSSGAARKVMDYFRRRKPRTADGY